MLSENKYRGKGVMGNLFLFHSTLITASRQERQVASRQSPVGSQQPEKASSWEVNKWGCLNERKRK